MSDNKSKYFVVTTQSVVRANNKGEALRAARSNRRVPGTDVLWSNTFSQRVAADTAHSMAIADN